MLIGHNPGMHDLAMLLAGARESEQSLRLKEKFPTGALAEFAVGGTWASLDANGGQLVRYLTPRDLPETTD